MDRETVDGVREDMVSCGVLGKKSSYEKAPKGTDDPSAAIILRFVYSEMLLVRLLMHPFDGTSARVVHPLESLVPFECDGSGARHACLARHGPCR